VPCEAILAKAKEIGADIIGLSGLITPSLDEMVYVARSMKREGFTVPLLIGGATTSKMHTAVKIQPQYRDSIHVLDASKAVVVVSSLLSEAKQDYLEDVREQYGELRDDYYAGMKDRVYKSLADARSKGLKINFTTNPPSCKPKFLGTRSIEVDLERLVESIDWNPFFCRVAAARQVPQPRLPEDFSVRICRG